MCIIMVKPSGVEMPDKATFERCCASNHDGAGFMFIREGMVYGRKGYMSAKSLYAAIMGTIVNPKETTFVAHARYKTHGVVGTQCCHPFPVVESYTEMGKKKWVAEMGVAHNGVFHNLDVPAGDKISDTMVFVKEVMAPHPDMVRNILSDTLMNMAIGSSKLAILDGKLNKCTIVGSFNKSPEGVLYSNYGWEAPKVYQSAAYPSASSNSIQGFWNAGIGAYRAGESKETWAKRLRVWRQCPKCMWNTTAASDQPCKSCLATSTKALFQPIEGASDYPIAWGGDHKLGNTVDAVNTPAKGNTVTANAQALSVIEEEDEYLACRGWYD